MTRPSVRRAPAVTGPLGRPWVWRCVMFSQQLEPVVVGVDGSAGSREALDLAAEEAVARVTPLTVVHVTGGSGRNRVVEDATARVRADYPTLAVMPCPVAEEDVVAALATQAMAGCLL